VKTTESRILRTTYGPPPEPDQPKSSFPLSTNPEITSTFGDESDTIETKALETLLPEVIEPNFLESDNLLPQVVEPEETQPSSHVTSSSS